MILPAAASCLRRSSTLSFSATLARNASHTTRISCKGGGRSVVKTVLCAHSSRNFSFHSFDDYAWPSSERASFAFGKLLSPGKDTIGIDEFVETIRSMDLDFNLSRVELQRVFNRLDDNKDGQLSLDEFKLGGTSNPFTKALVGALSGMESIESDKSFPPENFDPERSTADFYKAPLDEGFVGENAPIREKLDYRYHNNYTRERQLFQDDMIRKNVILGDESCSMNPWLVFTCGPMGAGKGWILGWMSSNGYLPLEEVSKIDPDVFKLRMPEWSVYQKESLHLAGSQTHQESSYLSEIALHLAMNHSANVWVDGSLRNYEWYEEKLINIRKTWPQYRIAIIAVGAPESTIQSRLKHRAEMTGRHVPEKLRVDSFRGFETGVRKLTPKVDLIASITNKEDSPPILESVSMIDSSGNWDLIKSLTNFGAR